MTRPSLEGQFDISACSDCMVRDTCHAYSFAGSVIAKVEPNVSAVNNRIANALDALYFANNEDGRTRAIREIDIAMRRIPATIRAFAEAETITTAIIKRAFDLQIVPDDILQTEISFTPTPAVPEETLPELTEIGPVELDKIGFDIRRYTDNGICGAIVASENL